MKIDIRAKLQEIRQKSDTANRLVDKLFEIWDNEQFVCYSLYSLDNAGLEKLYEYITDHNVTNSDDVMELVLCIEEGSEPDWK